MEYFETPQSSPSLDRQFVNIFIGYSAVINVCHVINFLLLSIVFRGQEDGIDLFEKDGECIWFSK